MISSSLRAFFIYKDGTTSAGLAEARLPLISPLENPWMNLVALKESGRRTACGRDPFRRVQLCHSASRCGWKAALVLRRIIRMPLIAKPARKFSPTGAPLLRRRRHGVARPPHLRRRGGSSPAGERSTPDSLIPFGKRIGCGRLAAAGPPPCGLDGMMPRTTLAQKMDALSSQANLAGYAAGDPGCRPAGSAFCP